MVSYKENGTRIYTPERIIDNQMRSILDQITIPEQMITDFQEYVQSNQQAEINFINSEIERLESEIKHIDKQLNRLFELRMAEEISKKEYQQRKADYNLQKSRLQTQLDVKYRGDDGFNITVLNTLKILSKAKDIFTASNRPIIDKQMLLRLLFKQLIIKEGKVACIPNEPFSSILGENRLKSITKDTTAKTGSCELQSLQGLEADLGAVSDGMREMPSEPHVVPNNTLIYKEKSRFEKQLIKTGWGGWKRFCQPLKSLILQNFSLSRGGICGQTVTPACHTL